MPAGYSGTPLPKKLGIKAGNRVAILAEPDEFRDLLDELPDDVTFQSDLSDEPDVVIAFYTARRDGRCRTGSGKDKRPGQSIIPLSGQPSPSDVRTATGCMVLPWSAPRI